MKPLLTVLVILTAGVIGYVQEPNLRCSLTGLRPDPRGVIAPRIDLSSLKQDQLPDTVKLEVDLNHIDESSGTPIIWPAGTRVKLLGIEGTDVILRASVIRAGETVNYRINLPVSKTDLIEQLAARKSAAAAVPEPLTEPAPPPAPAPQVTAEPAPVTIPGGDSQEPPPAPPAPIETIKPTPSTEPAPALEPAPTPPVASIPSPEPAPAASPEASPVASTSVDVVKLMQDSIRDGQIKEFKFEQVLDWKPGASEKVNGEEYQTGLATYSAETFLGVKTIQAKAFIKDGKVRRWIWPKSDMEIK